MYELYTCVCYTSCSFCWFCWSNLQLKHVSLLVRLDSYFNSIIHLILVHLKIKIICLSQWVYAHSRGISHVACFCENMYWKKMCCSCYFQLFHAKMEDLWTVSHTLHPWVPLDNSPFHGCVTPVSKHILQTLSSSISAGWLIFGTLTHSNIAPVLFWQFKHRVQQPCATYLV